MEFIGLKHFNLESYNGEDEVHQTVIKLWMKMMIRMNFSLK